jgi:hypothetical protein
MRRKFVIIHTTAKKIYCVHLIKFSAIMQHITYCMIRMIKDTHKEMIKKLFLLEFNKCNALFIINVVQETFVNSFKVFEMKNYFTTLFQFTTSCFICNYYIF